MPSYLALSASFLLLPPFLLQHVKFSTFLKLEDGAADGGAEWRFCKINTVQLEVPELQVVSLKQVKHTRATSSKVNVTSK